ncbi:Two pore calcium channel protein 1, partial [Frankliniella fusca]
MVERAFGALKNKWRRLYFLTSWNIEYAILTIVSSVVLHNFLRRHGQHEDNPDVPFQQVEAPELLPDDGLKLDFDHP